MYPKVEFQEMHPTLSLHDSPRYSGEGHMSSGVSIPASGVPDPNPIPIPIPIPGHAQPPYPAIHHPAYISNSLPRAPSAPLPGQWTSGLCHCFDDPVNCAITCVCPCITFGQITEIVNRGSKSCGSRGLLFGLLSITGCGCFYSCFYRSKLRAQYDLQEEPCTDCLVHFCCCSCALCQEYRELKNRGFDMGIGWEANMDRQKRGVTVAPIIVPGMARI